jgi:hypothetical protein
MPLILPRRYAVKPPTFARLDWDHPLTRDLVWCVAPGADQRHDHVGGGMGSLSGGATWGGATAKGLAGTVGLGGSDGLVWPWSERIAQVTTRFTVVVICDPQAAAGNWTGLFSIPYRAADFGFPEAAIILQWNSGADQSALTYATSPSSNVVIYRTSAPGYVALADPLTAYGVTRDLTEVRFWRNGVQHGATETGADANAVDFVNRQTPVLGNSHPAVGDNRPLGGAYVFGGLWARALSAPELAAVAANPWQLWQGRRLWAVPEAEPFVAANARIANAGAWSARAAFAVGGAFYVVAQDTGASPRVRVYKSADGTSWAEQDAADAPAVAGATGAFSAASSGGFLYVASNTTGTTGGVRRYDTTTDAWETSDLGSGFGTNVDFARPIRVAVRSDGDVVVAYSATATGNLVYSRYEGTTWTTNVSVMAAASILADAVLMGSDRVLFAFADTAAADTTYRTLDAANALGTTTDFDNAAHATPLRGSAGVAFSDGTNDKVAVLGRDSGGELDLYHGIQGATLGSLATVNAVTTTTAPQLSSAGTVVFDARLYAVWATANAILYDSTTSLTTLTFGADTTLLSGLADTDVAPQWLTGNEGLGVLYQEAGVVKVEWIVVPAGPPVPVSGSDAGTIGATEATAIVQEAAVAGADPQTVAGVEAVALTASIARTDAGTIAPVEATALAATTATTDAGTLGATEATDLVVVPTGPVAVGDDDAGTLAAAEAVAAVGLAASDTGGVVATEGTPVVAATATDAGALGAAEGASAGEAPGPTGEVTHVGTTNATGTTAGAGVSPPLPAGWQAGDLAFLAASVFSSTAGFTGPGAGWTAIRTTVNSEAFPTRRLATYYRVLQAGDGAPSVSGSGASLGVVAILAVFRGTETTGVLDAESGQYDAASDLALTAPGLTTTAADDLVVYAATTDTTVTPPSGYTEPANGEAQASAAVGEVAYKLAQAQGATGDVAGSTATAALGPVHLAAFRRLTAVPKAGTDAGTLAAVEAAPAIARSTGDGGTVAGVEAVAPLALAATDAGAVGAVEAQAIVVPAVPKAGTDAGTVGAVEAATVLVVRAAADSGTVGAGELAGVAAVVTGADLATVGRTEAQAVAVVRSDADAGTIGATEDALVAVPVAAADAGTLAAVEAWERVDVVPAIARRPALVVRVRPPAPLLGRSRPATRLARTRPATVLRRGRDAVRLARVRLTARLARWRRQAGGALMVQRGGTFDVVQGDTVQEVWQFFEEDGATPIDGLTGADVMFTARHSGTDAVVLEFDTGDCIAIADAAQAIVTVDVPCTRTETLAVGAYPYDIQLVEAGAAPRRVTTLEFGTMTVERQYTKRTVAGVEPP